MTIIGFDSGRFTRGKAMIGKYEFKEYKYFGFNTQLGVGVSIDDPQAFAKLYTDVNRELKESYNMQIDTPFFSSSQLKCSLGLGGAISFADKLITRVQEYISSAHYSYVILSREETPTIKIGGFMGYTKYIPADMFIEKLGPMFSYLTAHSFLWKNNYADVDKLELHIDSFRSKHTKAWNQLSKNPMLKIFTKGDECNPYISCADIMVFLTGAKLYKQYLKLNVEDLGRIWEKYDFNVTVQFFDKKSLPYYTWTDERNINLTKHLARPLVFLYVDRIESKDDVQYEEGEDDVDSKPRKMSSVIAQTPVYRAALRYAYQRGGCLKLFSRGEDFALVRDGDAFVYVGPEGKKIAEVLSQASRIQVYSGLEIREIVEKE